MILTVALETGIAISVDTLYDDFILDHRQKNYTDITVSPKTWVNLSTLTSTADQIRKISGVAKAGPTYYISVDQFADIGVTTQTLLYGIDSKTHPDFRHLNVTEGRRIVSGNTVMISKKIQEDIGLVVGQTYNLAEADPRLNDLVVTIGGVFSSNSAFGNKLLNLFVLIDIQTLLNTIPVEYHSLATAEIDIEVTNLLEIRRTGENIKDFINDIGNEYWVFLEKDISDIEATGIRAYQAAMNLVVLSSFIVEFLFITNILAIAIRDRQKEFGIFRAVGTESFQLIGIITAEILIYSIIGSTIGIFVGIGFSNILVSVLDVFYTGLTFESLSIHFSSIFASFLTGLIVALISGLYPILLALKTPVIQNIHSRMRSGKSAKFIKNWRLAVGMGVLLACTGFILQIFIGPSRFLDFEILSVHFLVIVLIFLGTILLEIGILVFLPRISMKILFWFGLITRTISTRNIAREFQKSLFTIMTAALSLTFIIVVGLTSAAVIAGVPDYFNNQWGAIDLVTVSRDTNPPDIDFTSILMLRNDITQCSFIQETRTDFKGYDAYVYGVNPVEYAFFAEPTIECLDPVRASSAFSYLNESTRSYLNVTTGNFTTVNVTYGLISHRLYQRLYPHIPLGDNLTINIGSNQTANITLAAVIRGNVFLGNGEYLYISSTKYQQYYNSTLAKYFLCEVEGSIKRAQLAIDRQFEEVFVEVIGVEYFTELMEQSLRFQAALFQLLFVESFVLAAIAQFICILVSTLRMEREMGIMRSMGLHKRGVLGIFMSESTALGFSALFIGLVDGLIGSVLLSWYISLSIPITVSFPIDRILLWVIASFLITIASTILPSYRSSQKNIIATISGRPMAKMYVEKPYKSPYYPFWPEIKPDKQEFPLPDKLVRESSGRGFKDISESITIWQFIKTRKFEIQTIFLLMMAIVTFNYIFDPKIIIRGLNPLDTLWRSLLIIPLIISGFLTGPLEYIQIDSFMLLNPLLFLVGLGTISPLAYFLINGFRSETTIKDIISGIITGIIALIICLLFLIIQIICINILFNLIIPLQENYWSDLAPMVLSAILFLLFLGCGLLFYQRVWYFLVLQGLKINLSFRKRLSLTNAYASKSQVRFIGLIMLHVLLQIVLTMYTNPSVETFPERFPDFAFSFYPPLYDVNPLAFLILTIFEVGSYLVFVIYPIVQLTNHKQVIRENNYQLSFLESTEINALKRKARVTADLVLHYYSPSLLKRIIDMDYSKDGFKIFVEEIQGKRVLFLEEDIRDEFPVAMNYSHLWPKKTVQLKPNIDAIIRIPNLIQMKKFLQVIEEVIHSSDDLTTTSHS
jgi:ABC-type lipoprotein release transport system permease subunit